MCERNASWCVMRDGHEGMCLTASQLEGQVDKEMKRLERELKNGIKAQD